MSFQTRLLTCLLGQALSLWAPRPGLSPWAPTTRHARAPAPWMASGSALPACHWASPLLRGVRGGVFQVTSRLGQLVACLSMILRLKHAPCLMFNKANTDGWAEAT